MSPNGAKDRGTCSQRNKRSQRLSIGAGSAPGHRPARGSVACTCDGVTGSPRGEGDTVSGTAGWISWEADLTREGARLEAMGATLKNRGPDGHGLALAPTRPGPPSAGRRRDRSRPASGPPLGRGDVGPGVDGQLYNGAELRSELAARGHPLPDPSDGELILAAYAQWGAQGLSRLNGVFACAIWSTRRERLFLARDPLGVKPLFYAARPGAFLFASELKALLAHPAVEPALDREGLAEVLVLGPARTPGHGIFRGVAELRPGAWLEAGSRRAQERNLLAAGEPPPPPRPGHHPGPRPGPSGRTPSRARSPGRPPSLPYCREGWTRARSPPWRPGTASGGAVRSSPSPWSTRGTRPTSSPTSSNRRPTGPGPGGWPPSWGASTGRCTWSQRTWWPPCLPRRRPGICRAWPTWTRPSTSSPSGSGPRRPSPSRGRGPMRSSGATRGSGGPRTWKPPPFPGCGGFLPALPSWPPRWWRSSSPTPTWSGGTGKPWRRCLAWPARRPTRPGPGSGSTSP